jgi:hypothetical protein
MIEITNRDTGQSVTYEDERAARMWGELELDLMLRSEHPGMRAKYVDGRGNPAPVQLITCSDCGLVLEVTPCRRGEERTATRCCARCSLEKLDQLRRGMEERSAVDRFWIETTKRE